MTNKKEKGHTLSMALETVLVTGVVTAVLVDLALVTTEERELPIVYKGIKENYEQRDVFAAGAVMTKTATRRGEGYKKDRV